MTHRELTYQSSDGLSLFYRDYVNQQSADAPSDLTPVICLPGLTRNSRDFDDIVERLSKVRRVICSDFRGRGFSDHDSNLQNYHPTRYASDTVELLDELDIASAIVIGTSLGGIVTMVISHEHAERVAAAVLNDIGPELDPRGAMRIAQYVGATAPVKTWDDAVAGCRTNYESALPDLSEAAWIAHTRAGWREGENGIPQPDYDPEIRTALQTAGAMPQDPWELFDALLPIPVVLLRGELSDLLSAEITDKMLARKPERALHRGKELPPRIPADVPLPCATPSLASAVSVAGSAGTYSDLPCAVARRAPWRCGLARSPARRGSLARHLQTGPCVSATSA